MDKEKTAEVRTQLQERDQYKLLNESYERSINLYKKNELLYEDKTNILLNQNKDLIQEIGKVERANDLKNFAYFFLGVLGTIAGTYAISKINH
jgi:hypothetical protein